MWLVSGRPYTVSSSRVRQLLKRPISRTSSPLKQPLVEDLPKGSNTRGTSKEAARSFQEAGLSKGTRIKRRLSSGVFKAGFLLSLFLKRPQERGTDKTHGSFDASKLFDWGPPDRFIKSCFLRCLFLVFKRSVSEASGFCLKATFEKFEGCWLLCAASRVRKNS